MVIVCFHALLGRDRQICATFIHAACMLLTALWDCTGRLQAYQEMFGELSDGQPPEKAGRAGDIPLGGRKEAIEEFEGEAEKQPILVCTDLAARHPPLLLLPHHHPQALLSASRGMLMQQGSD